MLTADQLEEILSNALVDVSVYANGHNTGDAISDAWEQLHAMRTPITRETMRSDGWNEKYADRFEHRSCSVVFPSRYREELNYYVVHIGGVLIRNVRTMHDLRELVRLLGGAK